MAGLKLKKIIEVFKLEVVYASKDIDSTLLTIPEVNRPGLQFHDFYDYFVPQRLQVLGKAEAMYLESLTGEHRKKCYGDLFLYDIPALVICNGHEVHPECMEKAREYDRTILRTSASTTD